MIYVLAFDPIKIQTLYASQNDGRNLSFVKDSNEVGNKVTRNGGKMTISKSCIFFNQTDFITNLHDNVPLYFLFDPF